MIDLNLKYNITYRQTMNIYSFICSSVKYGAGENDLMSGTGHLRDFHDTIDGDSGASASRVFADIKEMSPLIPIPTLKKSLL